MEKFCRNAFSSAFYVRALLLYIGKCLGMFGKKCSRISWKKDLHRNIFAHPIVGELSCSVIFFPSRKFPLCKKINSANFAPSPKLMSTMFVQRTSLPVPWPVGEEMEGESLALPGLPKPPPTTAIPATAGITMVPHHGDAPQRHGTAKAPFDLWSLAARSASCQTPVRNNAESKS